MNEQEFRSYVRTMRQTDRRLRQTLAAEFTIKHDIEPLGLKPLPTLWFENEEGERYVPDFSQGDPDYPDVKVFKYIHRRDPSEITHHMYKDVGPNSGWGEPIGGMNYGWSRNTGELAVRIASVENMPLSDALAFAACSCERCMNILANHYGLEWGYDKDSEDAQKVGTHCELCRQVDPDYDDIVRDQDAGIYGDNPVRMITASLDNGPAQVLYNSGVRLLSYLETADYEDVESLGLMESDTFVRVLCKHALASDVADLSDDEKREFEGYVHKLHDKLSVDPSTKKARAYLEKLGQKVHTAETGNLLQTDNFIRYLTLSSMSLPERVTPELLRDLRPDTLAFLDRFRYRRDATLPELARQTLYKFDKPASVLGYQQTLLVQLSHYILNQSPYNRQLVLANLKYLRDQQLPLLIYNP